MNKAFLFIGLYRSYTVKLYCFSQLTISSYIGYIIYIMLLLFQVYANSFNGIAIAQLLIAYQSSYYSISSIEKSIAQLVFACLLLYVNCSIAIESIIIQLQLKKPYSLTIPRRSASPPKVPPLQFFYKNSF